MENTHANNYAPPVDQLLTYGEATGHSPETWPNYLALGLGPEHVPDLIRMTTDNELHWADSDSLEVEAPFHAWRALGQLRAEEAIEPLISLFATQEDSEWVIEEVPEVLAMIGPSALPALATFIADIASYSDSARISAISGVKHIGMRWPEARLACVALLMKQLELFAENEPDVNGFLIMGLTDLHAIEAAPLIERAFAADSVDLFVMGDWDDVQVELGLLSAEELEQRRSSRSLPETPFPSSTQKVMLSQAVSRESSKREMTHRKAKNKSKMAKQSRKKNRRR